MYLIIEGMPSSGKTTLARALAEKFGAAYYKSLLPDDDFGNTLRALRDSGKHEAQVNLLHIIDLYRNELAVQALLDQTGSVVRDKCFLSSLAHFLTVDLEMAPELKKAAMMAYEQLAEHMLTPDAVVLLDRPLEDSLRLSGNKGDKTAIDGVILGDQNRFEVQRGHLRACAERCFPGRLIKLERPVALEDEITFISEKVGSR